MSESIRVDLARECDRAPLESFLIECGFVAQQAGAGGSTTLDVSGSAGDTAPLGPEVWDALTTWLAATNSPLVPTVIGRREYALTPPGD